MATQTKKSSSTTLARKSTKTPARAKAAPGRSNIHKFNPLAPQRLSAILDILAQYRVPATFFQVGSNVERLPDVARAVAAAGHAIGNHSYAHPLFCFKSPAFIEADLRRAQQTIRAHTGVAPEWFRPPYGVRWFGMGRALRNLSLTGVMWTAIGYDWKRNSDAVFGHLATSVSNGAILCLHDGRELQASPDIRATVEAVRRLVPTLLEQGYEFETVTRLLCPTT